MKKICVDKDVCIGCGACVAIAPSAFEFEDDGLAHVKDDFNYESSDDDLKNDVMDALEGCPTGAIKEED